MEDLQLINIDEAVHRLGGNKDLLLRLYKIFSEEDYISPIKNAIDEQNVNDAERASHTLKGVAANLSLEKLAAVATRMNKRQKNGDLASDLTVELIDVHEKTVAEIYNQGEK